MLNKKILLTLSIGGIMSTSLLCGCGCNNANTTVKEDVDKGVDDVKNGANDVKNEVEDAADEVKNAGEDLYSKISDNTMEYSNEDFAKDLKSKNIETSEIENKTEYFTADKYGYKVGDGTIYVYQYTTEDTLKNDINSIKDNGNRVDEAIVQWNKEAHIYKKGSIVVIYDGDDQNVLNSLKDILGNPIVG